MLVRRISMATGVVHELELPITKEQVVDFEKGMPIKYAFPDLSLAQIDFFLTGITPEENEK